MTTYITVLNIDILSIIISYLDESSDILNLLALYESTINYKFLFCRKFPETFKITSSVPEDVILKKIFKVEYIRSCDNDI